MADLTYLVVTYDSEIKNLTTLLTCRVLDDHWFCDLGDNVTDLIDRLESDLEEFNPQRISLGKTSYQEYADPYNYVIIPTANELSDMGVNKAVLLVYLEDIPPSDERLFFERLCPSIDSYLECAEGKTRYPMIFITEKRFLKTFLEESDITIPNHGGFKRRMFKMRVLNRLDGEHNYP